MIGFHALVVKIDFDWSCGRSELAVSVIHSRTLAQQPKYTNSEIGLQGPTKIENTNNVLP